MPAVSTDSSNSGGAGGGDEDTEEEFCCTEQSLLDSLQDVTTTEPVLSPLSKVAKPQRLLQPKSSQGPELLQKATLRPQRIRNIRELDDQADAVQSLLGHSLTSLRNMSVEHLEHFTDTLREQRRGKQLTEEQENVMRRLRRGARNRTSAMESRLRKKESLKALQRENQHLRDQVKRMEQLLRACTTIAMHSHPVDPATDPFCWCRSLPSCATPYPSTTFSDSNGTLLK